MRVAAWQARWIGGLAQGDPKRFPSIEEMTGSNRAPKRQDPDELLGVVKTLKTMIGGNGDG